MGAYGGILVIPSNHNGNTIKNVLAVVFNLQCIENKKLPVVDRITFLEVGEPFNMNIDGKIYSLVDGYEEILQELNLKHIEFRRKRVHEYAKEIPGIIMAAIREVGRENIILDLTSGKKDITGSLYTAATICSIDNMVYIEVAKKTDGTGFYDLSKELDVQNKFNLTKFRSLDELENLASQNCMEFIIYKKTVAQIGETINSDILELYCSYLNNAIDNYFRGTPLSINQSIQNIGVMNEQLIGLIKKVIKKRFGELPVEVKSKNILGYISDYENAYMKLLGKKKITEPERETLEVLSLIFAYVPTLSQLLKSIQIYRNQVSHEVVPNITKEDAKLVIDMMLKMLNGLCASKISEDLFESNGDDNE